ncbi:PstS family phosphate ABC transporter substrate-binding protein [Campylobacter suis]|uniref:Protein SphX n=1 Tax=Campylobacter suis TaxID=2790657 RepID=A0ABM8Q519_9BACT|nr:PstS family phosphate ABC transporter substrate-binding protein [Campylobacter suis]CAD7287909.1 Protein SphX [Campylobacter suis]
MKVFKSVVAASLLCMVAYAEQIRIAGSSTVFPFSSFVAEEFAALKGKKAPIVESLGTGGGFKAFCASQKGIDIANASRPMKLSEFQECEKNGINQISGFMIGYDGIVLAQNKQNAELSLTKEQIFLALAKQIPQNGALVDNPYKKWNQIDASLPDKEILVYGPPTTSGTRDSFEEQLMQAASKNFKEYGEKAGKYGSIREDGAYVPSSENDNLIVAKLAQNKDAYGIFGYGYLAENGSKVAAVGINGIKPSEKSVADGSYTLARSLYFYVKNENFKANDEIPAFIDLFISQAMIGKDGALKSLGLISLNQDSFAAMRKNAADPQKLSVEMVKSGKVIQ